MLVCEHISVILVWKTQVRTDPMFMASDRMLHMVIRVRQAIWLWLAHLLSFGYITSNSECVAFYFLWSTVRETEFVWKSISLFVCCFVLFLLVFLLFTSRLYMFDRRFRYTSWMYCTTISQVFDHKNYMEMKNASQRATNNEHIENRTNHRKRQQTRRDASQIIMISSCCCVFHFLYFFFIY